MNESELDGRRIRLDSASQRNKPSNGFNQNNHGNNFNSSNNFNKGKNQSVMLSDNDKNAKKGSIGTFTGKKIIL